MIQVFSGVDGLTGAYPRPPLEYRRPSARRGVMADVDARDLAASGWAVVFGPGVAPEVRRALAPLLRHRKEQAGALYRETRFEAGDEVGRTFLDRHNVGPGAVDPKRFPYHVLIVGSPASVPFAFQYRLSYPYAVGRLHFETPREYADYARTVVDAESAAPAATARGALFGPRHEGDVPTDHAARGLVFPLARELAVRRPAWRVERYLDGDATRPRLARLLGAEAPRLLFTAGHGVLYPRGYAAQSRMQGALVCQEWRGPRHGAPSRESLFTGDDVGRDADLSATIVFLLACYSAGTPRWDSYAHLLRGAREQLCSRPFTAHLAQRLLGRPGGALAVVGHVDQAMLSSFLWPGVGTHVQTFTSALLKLMDGHRVGAAMWYFAQRFAEISHDITMGQEPVDPATRARTRANNALWLAHNDARGYVVLGDPAVRLNVATPPVAPGGRRPGGGGVPARRMRGG